MEQIADELTEVIRNTHAPEDPIEAVALILADGRLERILTLPEFTKRPLYTHRGGNRQIVEISHRDILKDWVRGESLVDLANSYLGAVGDIEFRFEQLGDYISTYFEVQFPWILSTLIAWTNQALSEDGFERVSADIPSFIRWGVNDAAAVELLNRGILSRRLAIRIASEWRGVVTADDVYSWVRAMQLPEWQERFEPSTAELRSLLDYASTRRGGIAADLIKKESTRVEVVPIYPDYPAKEVEVRPQDESRFAQLAVFDEDEQVAMIKSRDQRDMQDILSIGVTLSIMFTAADNQGFLDLEILDVAT